MSLTPELAARAVAAVGDAIITVDRGGTITSWNAAAERLFGFSRQDAVGRTLFLIIPAEHRARHVAAFRAAMDTGHLAHGGAVARVEASGKSGDLLTLGLSLGLLRDTDGQVTGAVGVLRPLSYAIEFVAPHQDR